MNEDQAMEIAAAQQAIRHHLLVTYKEYDKRLATYNRLAAYTERDVTEELKALDAEYDDLEQQERDLWDQLQALYHSIFTESEVEITEVEKLKGGSLVSHSNGLSEYIPEHLIPKAAEPNDG